MSEHLAQRGASRMAEGVGFEPTRPVKVYLISSQARSTALPSLRS